MVTGHWQNLMLVLINLPFAFVGGVFAVALTGGLISLGSMVGFVTLFGITLRNSVLMISHYEHLVVVEGRAWGLQTAIDGAADRLIPILMTSVATIGGAVPIAMGLSGTSRASLGVAVVGGMITATAMTLYVTPVVS